jgi:hypothetical protein
MSDNTEKLEILNLIKEGKITPEQGVRLIEALDRSDTAGQMPAAGQKPPSGPRWINIEIKTSSDGKYKSLTPIRIPLSLVRLFFRFIPKDSSVPGSDYNFEEVLNSMETGKQIELHTGEGAEGRSVRITAE